MRRVLVRSLLPLVALVVLGAIAMRLVAGVNDIRSLPTIERPWLIAPATLALLGTLVTYAWLWRTIVFAIDRARPSVADSFGAFTCSWLGRYVPTSAPYVAGKVVLGARLGHRRGALVASVIYENVLVVVVGGGASAAVLSVTLRQSEAWYLWPGVSAACAAAVLLMMSRSSQRLITAFANGVPRLAALTRYQLSPVGLARATAVTSVSVVLNAAAFTLLLASFVPLSVSDAIIAAAAFNLAGAAGVAAVPLPSGIVVREAVLISILQLIVPVDVAVAAAILVRFISIPVDLLLGAVGALQWRLSAGRAAADRVAPASTLRDAA
jgi:uncharacterized membrane protein YbhN (UPF0104 family)